MHDQLKATFSPAEFSFCFGVAVQLQPLCVYVRGMVMTHLPNDEQAQRGNGVNGNVWSSAASRLVPQSATEPGVNSSSGSAPLAHELLAFAVGLLVTSLKRGNFVPSNPHHCSLLEPLLPLLQARVHGKSNC